MAIPPTYARIHLGDGSTRTPPRCFFSSGLGIRGANEEARPGIPAGSVPPGHCLERADPARAVWAATRRSADGARRIPGRRRAHTRRFDTVVAAAAVGT